MERNENGFKIYVESMTKSTDDKAKVILPLVRKSLKLSTGDILDLGAGGGSLSRELFNLAKEFGVKLTVVDADHRMIEILKEKFAKQPEINVVLANALDFELGHSFAVAVCSSFLHEIFSERGNLDDIRQVLKNIWNHLLPGGTLVIRDGIKPVPENEQIIIKPLKPQISQKLERFFASYKYLDEHPQLKNRSSVPMARKLAYEFAVKYQYPEINWKAEMSEQFGFWTEKEAQNVLRETGFTVIYAKKYLLDYFKKLFTKDFELLKQKGKKLVKIRYFNTHLVIAAKKRLD